MIEHLKLRDHKGLKECQLLYLQKVNVLCGKNNSGKTTILEAINVSEKRSIGKTLTKEDCNRMASFPKTKRGWTNSPVLLDAYESLFKRTLAQNIERIWFADESGEFANLIENAWISDPVLREFRASMSEAETAFRVLFQSELKSVLLPPKRSLQLTKRINTDERPMPDGPGILNWLFFAKNQEEDSGERRIYEQISAAFTKISSGYRFDVFAGEGSYIFLRFASQGSSWIHAGDCGLGLQDLLIVLYFSISPDCDMILIEEPESHIHPEMQKKLLRFLRQETSKQFFLSTHSSAFLDSSLVDRVFYTSFDDSVCVHEVTSKAVVLNELGYSVADNLVSDVIILTEGPTDRPVLEEFMYKMELMEKYEIKFWPLGGDIMDKVDLSVFAERHNVIALIDNDPGSRRTRKRFEENCHRYGIPMHKLERYAIENYFSLPTLRQVFGSQIPPELTKLDPDTKVEDQIRLDPKKNGLRIAQAMSLDEIKDTDLWSFLLHVKAICESS